jgi:SOS-response transcriptional repressor LexA
MVMENETLGARLTRLRQEAGFNKSRLGKKSGIDPGYIARIESGRIPNPGLPILKKLAAAMDLPLLRLIGEEESAGNINTGKLFELKRALGRFVSREIESLGEALQIPVRGYVRAGTPCVVEQEEGEVLIISRNLIESLTRKAGNVYALRIAGESLSGDGLHTGDDILVFQTSNFDIEGKLYVIRDPQTGESVVRHLQHKDGRIRITAAHPEYQPLLLDEVEVIGRVIYLQPQGRAL